jgi:hypothetical protein
MAQLVLMDSRAPGIVQDQNARAVFDSNAGIEKWLLCPVSQFPRSSEHEHEGEPLAADFGVSFSVERYAALGAG